MRISANKKIQCFCLNGFGAGWKGGGDCGDIGRGSNLSSLTNEEARNTEQPTIFAVKGPNLEIIFPS